MRLLLLGLILGLLFGGSARADALDDVLAAGRLRWAADQEGGGPFVFPRDDDPNTVTGFEVDLAAGLAAHLGVQAEFVQGPWDRLPDLVRTGKADIVLNGYERTPERLSALAASMPYYVYALQLLARVDDPHVTGWDALPRPRDGASRLQVGVLVGSAAETLARRICGDDCDVIAYEGNTDAMREVETGKLDATVQDTPIAAFYASRFPGLAPVDAAREPGHYVIYADPEAGRLVAALNDALVLMVRSGELERIYRRYGIWDAQQAELAEIAVAARYFGHERAVSAQIDATAAMPTSATLALTERPRGFEVVRRYGLVLLQSAGMTVVLAVLSFPLAVGIGLLVAVGRVYGPRWLRPALAAYVEFLRGTPLMLQLYFVFFFLPEIGITVPALATAILGLAINYSAYEAEIYRAGLQAVPKGQLEAALSLGMSEPQALRRIVVPQAFRIVIPPVVNDFIALFKDTSVCSVVTVVELTKRFSVLSQSTQATIELMALTALLYLLMSYPLAIASRRVERHLGGGAPA